MAFTEDLDEFFDTDEFADAITITKEDMSVVNLNGIFDNPSDEINVYNTAIETVLPVVRVKTSDISGIKVKNTLTHNTIDYSIERIETGGTGVSFLHLGK